MLDFLSGKKNFISIFLAVFPWILGLYFEWGVMLSVIILSVGVILILIKKDKVVFYFSRWRIIDLLIIISVIISFIIASDKGTAIYGIFRLIGCLELILIIMQSEKNQSALGLLSVSGILMLFVSFLFVMNPGLRSFVYSNVYGTKRFSAFIQYPNVSALYFLVCLVVFLYEISDYYERQDEISILEKVISTIFTLIFLAGIFFTGSRYVYLLTIVAFIYIFIEKKNLRRLILVLLCAGGFSGLVFVLLYRKGEGQNISFNAFNYLSDDKSFQTRLFQYEDYEYLEYSITDADFSEENLSVALNVIKLNDNSDAAYTFLAQYYFSKNDFMTASEYYRKAILSNRYDSQVYLRYKSVLNYEIEVSQNMNGQNMISFCEEELTWVDKRILKIKQETYEKAEELQMTLMI